MAEYSSLQKPSDQSAFSNRKFRLRDISLEWKIKAVTVLFAIVSCIAISFFILANAKGIIRKRTESQLISVRESTKSAVENWFKYMQEQAKFFSDDQMVCDAITSFKYAYNNLDADSTTNIQSFELENYNIQLTNFYRSQFLAELNPVLDAETGIGNYLPEDSRARLLQYFYIAANPNQPDARNLLDRAVEDNTVYGSVHVKYHPVFNDYLQKFYYKDIYLVDGETGNIVYTVMKKTDFGTNLLTGPYKNSPLTLAFMKANQAPNRDYVLVTDLKNYDASLGQPVAFIASPIFSENKRLGVLIFQISTERLTDILSSDKHWEDMALGKTGDVYIIGQDYYLRSEPRMLLQNKAQYFRTLKEVGYDVSEIKRQEKRGSALLYQQIKNDASIAALKGLEGTIEETGYLGSKTIAAYASLDIRNLNWAIIAEINRDDFFSGLNKLRFFLIIIGLFVVTIAYITIHIVAHNLAKRIRAINEKLLVLSKGEAIEHMNIEYNDELGATTESMNVLAKRLIDASQFAISIGNGDFGHEFEPASEKDELGISLSEMKKSLLKAKEEEQLRVIEDEKRNWVTHGIARFSDILRTNNDSISKLSSQVVTNLVEYLKANMAGIYILNENETDGKKYVELSGSYAYDREKHISRKFELGEGLVGTCAIEKKSIYLKQIPDEYIKLASAFGEAKPKCLLLVPMVVEDQVTGVLEIGSLKEFQAQEIEFVEKIAEVIGSTIISVKINAKTSKLLEESKLRAEELAAQEEEMRQNMEELTATQEEMNRIKAEEEKRENERREAEEKFIKQIQEQNDILKKNDAELAKEKALLDALLNSAKEHIYFKDKESKFIRFSHSMIELFGLKRADQLIGKSDFDFFTEEHSRPAFEDEQKIIKTRIPIIDQVEKNTLEDGNVSWVTTTKMPLTDSEGNVIGTFGISKDITPLKKLEEDAKLSIADLKEKEEEIRTLREEMAEYSSGDTKELVAKIKVLEDKNLQLEATLKQLKETRKNIQNLKKKK